MDLRCFTVARPWGVADNALVCKGSDGLEMLHCSASEGNGLIMHLFARGGSDSPNLKGRDGLEMLHCSASVGQG